MRFRSCAAVAALLLLAPTLVAAAPVRAERTEAELVAERGAWLAGRANTVALRLLPDAGWHTYWRNPGDSGLATKLEWQLPDGWTAGEIQWPLPSVERLGELVNYGYSGETLHLVELTPPAQAPLGPATVRAKADWLVCSDICIPASAQLELTLPVAEIATTAMQWATAFEETRARLPQGEPLPGVFTVGGGDVSLRVEAGAVLAGAQEAYFFAGANDLVNHGAPQRVAIESGSVRFTQAQSAYLNASPAAVEGVLVVDRARAYPVAAVPGAVDPLPPAPAAPAAAPAEELSLLFVLGAALLGGLILNLMPCVFPVLSIKAVSVMESRRADPAGERRHALAYTAGVIGSCVAAALALLGLRAGGEALGWGFQLQSPVFVGYLSYLMFALGLSLSGLVQFGTRLMGMGQGLTERGGYSGSFFTGVLAVVVASPCTAPFMGTALGYAMVQPVPVALAVFAALGLGLALPFLLIGFVPALARALPRPGAWMERFKQFMAFPLYLSAVWLAWVLGRQSGLDALALLLCGAVLLALALWLWSLVPRGPVATLLALLSLAGAVALPAVAPRAPQAAPAAQLGEPWSAERVSELRARGIPVFVDFTADWCITCKLNERTVLSREDVRAALQSHGVVTLVADWTRADPAITAALAEFGRNGVPLYVLYPPRGQPEVLPQVLTRDSFLETLDRLL